MEIQPTHNDCKLAAEVLAEKARSPQLQYTRIATRLCVLPASANMSRFFYGSDSSSESSSDEEELYSEEEEEQKSEEESSEEESDEEDSDEDSSDSDSGKTGANRFLRDESSEDESDEEDDRTVVKSAKDKRFDELEGTIRLIENAQKINDWSVINDSTSAHHAAVHAPMR